MLNSVLPGGMYTRDGTLLTPNRQTQTAVETAPGLPLQQTLSWLSTKQAPLPLHAFPVYGDERRQTLLGHGLIRIDFMPALLRQAKFHFADTPNLKLALEPGETLTASQLFSRLNFSARPDPDQLRFQTILSRTLLALFVLLLSASLLGFVAYNRLLVRPLGRLTQDIDAMQHGRFSHNPSRSQPMRISELENIRRSLHDYQLQLRELHARWNTRTRIPLAGAADALTGCHNRRAYEEDWKISAANWKPRRRVWLSCCSIATGSRPSTTLTVMPRATAYSPSSPMHW